MSFLLVPGSGSKPGGPGPGPGLVGRVPRPAFHDVYDRLQGKKRGDGRKDGRGVERRYVKKKKKKKLK